MPKEDSHKLAKAAETLGGYRTFYFRQADDLQTEGLDDSRVGKVYKEFTSPKGVEMGGVCATVCAFWVVFHAKQETSYFGEISVWDYIFNNGKVNRVAAYSIATEHALSYVNQESHLAGFLESFGVKRRAKRVSGTAMSNSFISSGSLGKALVEHITSGGGGYKLLSMKPNLDGSGSGHMVAAYWDWSDVVFMDSNFGEFWLPNRAAFEKFMEEYFKIAYLAKGASKFKAIKAYHFAPG